MSYREAALVCPGCGEALEPKQVGEAAIDACPGCGGIWVDWFDGEISAMVRGAPPVAGAGAPDRRSLESAARTSSGRAGSSACPRCSRPLDAERYLESQAEILRCGDCSGAFVPRDAAPVIAGVDPERKGPPPAGDAWSRLAAVLQRWLGWDDKEPE